MSENIYAEFEHALMAVLTDQDNRMELRDPLHHARSKIDRTNDKFLTAIGQAIIAKDEFLEACSSVDL
jgi:hypothetical protein